LIDSAIDRPYILLSSVAEQKESECDHIISYLDFYTSFVA